jgi:hypothetical protein
VRATQVAALQLKAGDDIEVRIPGDRALIVDRDRTREQTLAGRDRGSLVNSRAARTARCFTTETPRPRVNRRACRVLPVDTAIPRQPVFRIGAVMQSGA